MNIKIYQIGGSDPDLLLGVAHDITTGRSLVRLARLNGASGVSLHGCDGSPDQVSGEFTLSSAESYFQSILAKFPW